jgi:DNA polymerase-3 subunit epsilon
VAARRIGERRASERRALAVKTENVDEDLWLRVDSFGLLQALRYLALRLQDEYEVREVRLSLTRSGSVGAARSVMAGHVHEQRDGDELAAGSDDQRRRISPLSVVDVIERCNGDIWFQRERVSHRAFLSDHAAGRRGAEGSAAGDHGGTGGRASRVL